MADEDKKDGGGPDFILDIIHTADGRPIAARIDVPQAALCAECAHEQTSTSSSTFDMGGSRPSRPLTREENAALRATHPFTRPLSIH